jgi:two-component system phosphate regulon sensor histidine kinase PhoR
MWSSRLFWKIFGAAGGLVILLALALGALANAWQRQQIIGQVERRLRDAALVLAGELDHASSDASAKQPWQARLQRMAAATGLRYTIVAPDGTVVADSALDPRGGENHRTRPEIQEALSGRVGVAQRRSVTIGREMLYVAVRAEHGGATTAVVRIAEPLDGVEQDIARARNLIWGLAAGSTLLSLGMIYLLARHLVRPIQDLAAAAAAMASGRYDHRPAPRRRDELGQLAQAFGRLGGELTLRMGQVERHGQQLGAVLENMLEGVIATDAQRRVMFANRAAQALLEISGVNLAGRPLWEIVRHPEVQQTAEAALRTRTPQSREFEFLGQARRMLGLHVTPLPGDPSPGLVLVLHDLTELRRLERLRQEFVANVSHELKTPLSAIQAYAETLREGALHDPQHNLQFVERIENQAQRLGQLIHDLLSLATIETGQQPLEIVTVPLSERIPEWTATHAAAAQARRIELTTEPPPREVQARADEDALRHILDNLLNNAIKYTPEGGRVAVRWRTEGNQAVVEVADTGIGISPADQQRIFERFYRVDKARSRELGGTGLGLSIVKHLVQALGGSVAVQSRVGAGSVFTVRLPSA